MLPIARRLRHPVHFVLGNHEFAVDDAHKPQVPARLGMPARYYSFERHGWLFLVTDGNDLSSYAWPQGSPEYKRSMDAHAARSIPTSRSGMAGSTASSCALDRRAS